jgi:nucleoside phosphorylase
MGLLKEATAQFEEAERMQEESGAADAPLFSRPGFQYCNLLLEQGRDADVRGRATQTLKIAENKHRLLDIALDHLSLGRSHLLAAQRDVPGDLAKAASHLAASLDSLRRAGQQGYLPLGLLARAALHTHTRDFDLARHDLDEALTLAQRCGFRLHEADAHLGLARLSLAEGHPVEAREHLTVARRIITDTGYHRRDGELADLQKMLDAAPLPPPAPPPPPTSIPEAKPAVTRPAPLTCDVAVVCALLTPELEKVLATGKEPWIKLPVEPGELTQYRATSFQRANGQRLAVVAAAPAQMGMSASAALATKMVQRFQPKLVAMVGIAAGVNREKQGFGDVLAPHTTFDYGAGRLDIVDGKLRLHPDANPISVEPIVRARLTEWTLEEERLAAIRRGWPGPKPDRVLKLHVGPLGSGAAVVAANDPVEATKEHWRKLIGIEMEAYGVHLASQVAHNPPPMFLCMKSICDFAGPDKDDRYQDYAAYTAAQLFHQFVTEEWDTLFPR